MKPTTISPLLRAQAMNDAYATAMPTPRSKRRGRRSSQHPCLTIGAVSGIVLFTAFMLIGSDPVVTALLCSAWAVAWAAVDAAGGFRTVTGWFAFFPLFHFLLFSLPLKVLFWDQAEANLRAPYSTSLVMLLFYVGVYAAALVFRRTKFGETRLCSSSEDPEFYRWLAWMCFLLGSAAFLVSLVSGVGGGGGKDAASDEQTGAGVASFLMIFRSFSVAAYVFYAWRAGKNIWKLPAFWLFLLVGLGTGILASAKGETSQPIVYLLVAMCSIYGLRSYKLLIGCAVFGLIFSSVIYPIMHYARGVEGARSNSLTDRMSIMSSIAADYISDSRFRETVKKQVDEYAEGRSVTYLPESAGVFDRFIMIGPTDLLVGGVDESSDSKKFHGFELFRGGLEFLVPRFLYPDKPDVGSSEALADIAGTRNAVERTNPTWGVPAQLYYSFGFAGVLLGAFVIELVFFIIINVWFGSQVSKSLWFCLIVVTMNMDNSCAAIDGIPFLVGSLCLAALGMSKLATWLSTRLGGRWRVTA